MVAESGRPVIAILAVGLVFAGLLHATGRRAVVAAASEVSVEQIRRHTVVLGSDALEGRAPGTAGGRRAAAYIEDELRRLGVRPWGDEGGFLQHVPLHAVTPLDDSRLVLTSLGEARELALGSDYLLLTTGAQTWLPRPVPMVFVGYGIVAPEFDYNDYADVDVRGKVVAFLDGEPRSADPEYFAGPEITVYSAADTKQRIALSRGAVGSVLIPVEGNGGEDRWQRLQREFAFDHLTLAYSIPRHLSFILHPSEAPGLFEDALFEFHQVLEMRSAHTLRSFHLPVSVSFEGSFRARSFTSPNVIGLIEGSDPKLKDSYVIVSAHYDHLGVGPEVAGDSIYNGVVDNALGVAGVLEIARVLAQSTESGGSPRRSVVLLFSTAEEEGNLGSSFFLDHPPAPLSSFVANINVDGLAFFDVFDDVVGIGAELSDLGSMLAEAARALGIEVSRPEEFTWGHEAYARSDQAAFAAAGVPAILVSEGFSWHRTTREEALERAARWLTIVYHTPADDLDQPLDFSASAQHLRVVMALALTVADAPFPPDWHPGVPYAYQRALSLANESD
jgi:Zn-dependent M28 family amino/carboxypeptidase